MGGDEQTADVFRMKFNALRVLPRRRSAKIKRVFNQGVPPYLAR